MKKIPIMIAVLLCLAMIMAACTSGEIAGGEIPTDDFTPETEEHDSELFEKYEKYKSDTEAAFKDTPAAPDGCFELEDVEGGVKITRYVGESKVLVIPGQLSDGRTVVGIGEGAFADQNMRAIYVPDTVTDVDAGAFSGCRGLLTVRFPKIFGGYIGYAFGADEYGENAITVPASLTSVILGEGVAEIPENAFAGCKTLCAVALPDSVTSIGKFAFYECGGLVYVRMGENIKAVGEYAFGNCSDLYMIDCKGADTVSLGAFYGCSALYSITLSVIGADENTHIGYIFGAETVEHGALYVSPSLRKVILTDSCESVPARAFSGCDGITSVELGKACEIGDRAFYGCRSLVSVSSTSNVESIGDEAFMGCESLVTIELCEGLTTLGMQAFMGCRALKSIELPESLTEIKPATFYGCGALVTVELGGVNKIGKDAFYGCQRLVPVSTDGIEVSEGNEALTAASGRE